MPFPTKKQNRSRYTKLILLQLLVIEGELCHCSAQQQRWRWPGGAGGGHNVKIAKNDNTYISKLKRKLGGAAQQEKIDSSSSSSSFWAAAAVVQGESPHSTMFFTVSSILTVAMMMKLLGMKPSVDGDEEAEPSEDEKEEAAFTSCELAFEKIHMTLQSKKKPKHGMKIKERIILDGSLKGIAKPGRMLAIMGPSGSGKTTLLHAIAGRIGESKQITLRGKRYINNMEVPGHAWIPSAFVEQDVNFFPHMTIKETLDFRVQLKLGKKLPDKTDRDELVQKLMDTLSLTKSANTIVGNNKVRGVSGGERKRLSIACEMIDSPPIVFLDEPTSGLDSYQAMQVVETLRTLADQGKTVIAVIHQPSQAAFGLFDDLLLLSEGRQMYFGEVSKVRSYFDSIGYPCLEEEGTAEHVLDVVSAPPKNGNGNGNGNGSENNGTKGSSFMSSMQHLDEIAAFALDKSASLVMGPNKSAKATGKSSSSSLSETADISIDHWLQVHDRKEHQGPSSNRLQQFRLLLTRSFREVLRGRGAILVKAIQQVVLGVIYGGIYKLGNDQASIRDRIGLLWLITTGTLNMSIAGTVRTFPKEKAIVMGEMAAKLYSTLPYFVSKAISEIPVIAALSGLFSTILYPLVGLQQRRFQWFLALTCLHSVACQGAGLAVGAVSSNSDVALALLPPIIVLNLIFDGKNLSEESAPRLLRWIPKVSLVRWGYEGLAVNEFDGLEFVTKGPPRGPIVRTGKEALLAFGIPETRTVNNVLMAHITTITVCWTLSYLGLSLTRNKYEVMKAP